MEINGYMKNNLFMSVFLIKSNISLKKLTSISCKIVQKSLFKLVKKIQIKKPNDILIDKKKFVEYYKKRCFIIIINSQ